MLISRDIVGEWKVDNKSKGQNIHKAIKIYFTAEYLNR